MKQEKTVKSRKINLINYHMEFTCFLNKKLIGNLFKDEIYWNRKAQTLKVSWTGTEILLIISQQKSIKCSTLKIFFLIIVQTIMFFIPCSDFHLCSTYTVKILIKISDQPDMLPSWDYFVYLKLYFQDLF